MKKTRHIQILMIAALMAASLILAGIASAARAPKPHNFPRPQAMTRRLAPLPHNFLITQRGPHNF